jgi:hypothetical protein
VAGGGDFILVVKGNQERLLTDVQQAVTRALDGELPADVVRQYAATSQGHGRRQERSCFIVEHLAGTRDRKAYGCLATVRMCCRERSGNGAATTRGVLLHRRSNGPGHRP